MKLTSTIKVRCLGLLFLLTICVSPVSAQKFMEALKNFPADLQFSRAQQIINAYYDSAGKGPGTDYKQWKREEWWLSRHLGESGKVEDVAGKNAEVLQERNLVPNSVESANGSWLPIGPTSISNDEVELGRVVCIAFHPNLANTFYVGTPAGGLWKTSDGGNSYTPLTDQLPGLGVASIVIHPTNPSIIYILTGDGNASHRGHYLREHGTGIYKSLDGGLTWEETAFINSYASATYGYKLLMHPSNTLIIYAATSTGLWKTTNGGSSWSPTLPGPEITDIEFDPNNSSRIYACGYSKRFYHSSNSGSSWDSVSVVGIFQNPDRMEIDVSADAPDNVWLLQGPALSGSTYSGLFKSQSNGISGSWTQINNSPNILGYANDGSDDFSQTWRNISLYVSNTNASFVLAGGSFIWRSFNGGSSFTKSSGLIHADNHFIVRHNLSTDLYSGCDGGLYKSTDGGTNWINLTNGLQISQYYRIAGTPQNFSKILAGAQDNGQHIRSGTSSFRHVTCCDGMDNAISSLNSNISYACTQYGNFLKSTDGLSFANNTIAQPTGGEDYWVTNILLHPTRPDTIYFGGSGGIRRSYNGALTWTDIGSNGEYFMAQGYSNVSRMYVANDLVTNGLTIQTTTTLHNTTPTWTTISGGANYPAAASGKFITGMVVNPNNSSEMWFTLAGYFSGQKVYRTIDAGATWENMSGSLPNFPVHCIVFEDNNGSPGGAVYIGTEMGVYYRDDNLNGWRRFGNGLPNSPVTDLYVYKNGSTDYITAATFGRGLWRSPLYTLCPTNLSVTGAESGYTIHQASNSVTSTNTISGGTGTELFLKAGSYVDMNVGFDVEATDGEFSANIGFCELQPAPPPLITNFYNDDNVEQIITEPFSKTESKRNDPIIASDNITYFLQINNTSNVNIRIEDNEGKIITTLHSGIVSGGNYSIGLKKFPQHTQSLFVVIIANGMVQKYQL